MDSKRELDIEGDHAPGLNPHAITMPLVKRQKTISVDRYTLAWICALPIEMSAAIAMLDDVHHELPQSAIDINTYVLGRIGHHNVVIACLPVMQYGTVKAAAALTHTIRSFPSIDLAFMVGIGGGAPSPSHDIRLGDVVVGTRVMPYDLSKVVPGGLERTDVAKHLQPRAGTLVSALRARHDIDGGTNFYTILQEQSEKHPAYSRPNLPDRLFHATYCHDTSNEQAGLRGDMAPASFDCDGCDASQIVTRAIRDSTVPTVYYGAVASGNQVMREGTSRDQYARDLEVICFEMESAGLIDFFPCVPIRGICDYSDTHKNKDWQRYAALVAASFARELANHLPIKEVVANVLLPRSDREVDSNRSLPLSGDTAQQARRQKLLDSLEFEHIDTRKLTINAAHAKTCQWLLELPDYQRWLDHGEAEKHHGFLWIRGKPGAGKSTIMKFIYGKMKSKDQRSDNLTVSFFFHARGSYLERSISGMYRSLLVQILEAFPDLQHLFDDSDIVPRTQNGCPSLEVLKSLLQAAVLGLGANRSLNCFIDALDECDEQQMSDMVRYFEDLSQNALEDKIRLRICFSSRHYPYIDIRVGVRLILENMAGHTADLTEYIQVQLRVKDPLLFGELLKKSAGVFLWVKLVVDILNAEKGRGGFALRKRLSEVPEGLTELFRDLIKRDSQNMEDFRLCILLILGAKRPLSSTEFHHALWAGLAREDLADNQPPETNAEDSEENAKTSVVSSSKGLAEITQGTGEDMATVQFMHESVRDFLIKDRGLYDLWPNMGLDWESASHELLKSCCSFYLDYYTSSKQAGPTEKLRQDAPTSLTPPSCQSPSAPSSHRSAQEYQTATTRSTKKRKNRQAPSLPTDPPQRRRNPWPLLKYASYNVLYHADSAAKAYPQEEFLALFNLQQWVTIHNAYKPTRIRQYNPKTNLVYVLAHQEHSRLLRFWLEQNTGFNVLDQIYSPGPNVNHEDESGRTALIQAVVSGNITIAELLIHHQANINHEDKSGRTALIHAVERGDATIVELLIRHQANVNHGNKSGRTALIHAVERGNVTIAELLIRHQANVNHEDESSGWTALHCASYQGHVSITELLIRNQADVNCKRVNGGTPLMEASRMKRTQVADILIQHGADVNSLDNQNMTALIWAVLKGYEDVSRLLLQHNADINCKSNLKGTALTAAARCGSSAIVNPESRELPFVNIARVLLENGADVDARDHRGWTPLMQAAIKGKASMVRFLLQSRADKHILTKEGHGALYWASKSHHSEIVAMLADDAESSS